MKKMQQEDVKAAKEKKGKDKAKEEIRKEKNAPKGKAGQEKSNGQRTQNGPNGQANGKFSPFQGRKQNQNELAEKPRQPANPSKLQKASNADSQQNKNKQHQRRQSDANEHADVASHKTVPGDSPVQSADASYNLAKKEKKKFRLSEPAPSTTNPTPPAPAPPPRPTAEAKLTPLQAKMKASLSGARFRWINEQLYTTTASSAHGLIRTQPNLYQDYHAGFAAQVESWPVPPLDALALLLQGLPKQALIADLGSGPGTLARKLVPQGRKVLSFDLQADEWVTEADFCERIPLPGKEGAKSEAAVVDAAVCCLSLMGTDWVRGVREARRVLVNKGQLFVAEVTSRFTDVEAFVDVVEDVGFRCTKQDDKDTHFTLFVFEKVTQEALGEKGWEKIVEKTDGLLKPCEYKRR